eukprot:319663_1
MSTSSNNYHLVFDIKHCIFKAGDETVLIFSIYDNTIKQYITEQYCLRLSIHNFPLIGSPDDQKVLFKNLSHHALNNDLYIICYIYRIGAIQTPDVLKPKKNKKKFKQMLRPFGATVFKLVNYIAPLYISLKTTTQEFFHHSKQISVEPSEAPIYCQSKNNQQLNEKDFINIPFDIINDNTNSYQIAPLSIGIAHSYTLYNGSLETVEKHYEHYNKLTIIEPIIDGKWISRQQILLITLLEASVNQKKNRSACNVQIRMNFRDNNSYENMSYINFGAGQTTVAQDEIESAVFIYDNNPKFQQTFSVILPDDKQQFETYHLYFGVWNVKEKKNKKDDGKGFAILQMSDVICSNYKEYELPLYKNNKKIINKYLESDVNSNLKFEENGANVKVAVRVGNLSKFFNLLVYGFMRVMAQNYNFNIPNDLLDLIKISVY